ncbi:MAG: hypothetical protein HC906_10495 [Bacteroidales bacterium]|nr:hypothetical protein [Bacteroidales bacterium]
MARSKGCYDELLKIQNLVYILGNHDSWALEWVTTGNIPEVWISQGGAATIRSYKCIVPEEHKKLLKTARYYYIEENKVFVHGGFNIDKHLNHQNKSNFLWDRKLVYTALEAGNTKLTQFDEIYLGHTPTLNFGSEKPIQAGEIFLMDTGCGWPNGFLTIMNCKTKEFFQSDKASSLYPNSSSR